jgi:hypothetical protein
MILAYRRRGFTCILPRPPPFANTPITVGPSWLSPRSVAELISAV